MPATISPNKHIKEGRKGLGHTKFCIYTVWYKKNNKFIIYIIDHQLLCGKLKYFKIKVKWILQRIKTEQFYQKLG